MALTATVALGVTLLAARTLTVDDDGPAEFRSIQAAIGAALPGDVVSVAPGAYLENLVLKSGVAVTGGGSEVTVVDGSRRAPVATLIDCDAATRLEGFRLTGGRASAGGGLLIRGGAPTVRFNDIVENLAMGAAAELYGYGGGVALLGTAADLSDNRLAGNGADFGGGLHLEGGAPRVTRNLITGNTAGAGGGIDAYVYSGNDVLIASNRVSGNVAIFGGGLELAGYGAPRVTNNLIVGNSATASGARTGYGGGADAYYSQARVAGNTLSGNAARTGGGVAILSDGAPVLVNNILLGNMASSEGGAADLQAPAATVRGNVFHGNDRGDCSGSSSALCLEPSNLATDPRLVDPAGGDYRPGATSPAVDSAVAMDLPPDDIRGRRRPLDGNRDGVAAHDRGAWEFDRDDVPGLMIGHPGAITWQGVSGAQAYHVYSGPLGGGAAALPGACRDAEDADPTDRLFLDSADPQPGSAVAYLVTAVVGGAEQSPGFDAAGLERTLPAPCP